MFFYRDRRSNLFYFTLVFTKIAPVDTNLSVCFTKFSVLCFLGGRMKLEYISIQKNVIIALYFNKKDTKQYFEIHENRIHRVGVLSDELVTRSQMSSIQHLY